MADPLNPRLGNKALIERILRHSPGLTREEVIAEAAAFGLDLTSSRSSPPTKSNEPTPNEPTPISSAGFKLPANSRIVTSARPGRTLTLTGARHPPRQS
jgi:hypothetical protein